jgi:hypothetical protein
MDGIVSVIRKIVLGIAVFGSGLMIGCASTNSHAIEKFFNMEYLDSDLMNWTGSFYLYEDEETHVEYIVYYNNGYVSITPRYDADGKLYINRK